MRFSTRTIIALTLSIAGFSNLSCKVNDYCLACARGDGGPGDVGPGDGGDGGPGMDGSGSGSGCVPDGPEICDGKDNDCNGLIDDGTLPQVGSDCQNTVGECAGGVLECVPKHHCSVTVAVSCFGATDTSSCPNGETCVAEDITTDHLGCTKNPSFEICDNKDNNCNGQVDEGDPGGGTKCGTDVGECVAGTNHCVSGAIQCQGAIGGTMPPYGSPEVCDGKDNNCNGMIDEGITLGQCPGETNVGACMIGTLQCIGGAPQCVGGVDPTFEICDGIDNDCDGVIDNGYNKVSDPNNCGASCTKCTAPANANPVCTNGVCGFACKPGYQDLNGNPADGCEFGPCFSTGPEVCDGIDNNCNGQIDEGVTINNFCNPNGECAGTLPTCTGTGGWVCNYPSTVETNGTTIVAQETRCDGKDNDCDGRIDEGTPNLGDACHDTGVGVCEKFGINVCDTTNITGPAVCQYNSGGGTASAEACNNLDDDCDGNVDEDMNAANVTGISWVSIGGGKQMAQYEMSKPDATTANPGSVTAHACSQQGVQPWTNVTYPQAVAACASIGATLCSEEDWHRACSALTKPTFPLAAPAAGVSFEAEDFLNATVATSGVQHEWIEDSTAGHSGIMALAAQPNSGAQVSIANATAQSPRLDYSLSFAATSNNTHVWVRMFAPSSSDNTVFVALTTTAPPQTPTKTLTAGSTGAWVWVDSGALNVNATGTWNLSIYMGGDAVKIDRVFVIQPASGTGSGSVPTTNTTAGGTWSYATSNTTYQPTTCVGQDFNYSIALTSESRTSNVVTVTTSGPHLFGIGDTITITGSTGGFNGTFSIDTVPSATTFTFAQTAADGTGTGGTATDSGDDEMPTGSLTSCYAAVSASAHPFDMSGNVKEWVLAHQSAQNPIRGGAANNTSVGISCALNFTLADDTFFFTNVGFRCCK